MRKYNIDYTDLAMGSLVVMHFATIFSLSY